MRARILQFFFACRCSNTHVFRVTVFCLALVRPPAGFCPFVHLNLDEFCDLKQKFLFNLARETKRHNTSGMLSVRAEENIHRVEVSSFNVHAVV